jgi:hypothetical protein
MKATNRILQNYMKCGVSAPLTVYQETNPPHERLQILSVCISNTGWDRSRTHDQKAPIWNQWSIRISAIRLTRCIIVSSVSPFCNYSEKLRQNLAQWGHFSDMVLFLDYLLLRNCVQNRCQLATAQNRAQEVRKMPLPAIFR